MLDSKKILIIDDDQDTVKQLEELLTNEKFEVLIASDGLTGLNMAREENPDIIILDIMLPKVNGYKVSRFLKFDDNYKELKIIMLSAKSEEKDKKIGKETGCDLYLAKPFDADDLIDSINGLLD